MSSKSRSKLRRKTGRGVVLLIALLLLSSAIVRVSSGAGSAFAQAVSDTNGKPGIENASADQGSVSGNGTEDRAKIGSLLAALQAREARVIAREKRIEMRAKALSVADKEIERRLEALESAEANLRQTLSLADGAAEDDLARLTAVYESMKPKDAAALFEAMAPNFAAGFLGRMRAEAAAAVMAGLSPDAAYSISVILAGRNAKAPKT